MELKKNSYFSKKRVDPTQTEVSAEIALFSPE